MQLDCLYELQFASCLLKDAAGFNADSAEWDSAEWKTLCFCESDDKVNDFIKVLELSDQFKNELCTTAFSNEFHYEYFYRVVKSSKKMLVL